MVQAAQIDMSQGIVRLVYFIKDLPGNIKLNSVGSHVELTVEQGLVVFPQILDQVGLGPLHLLVED